MLREKFNRVLHLDDTSSERSRSRSRSRSRTRHPVDSDDDWNPLKGGIVRTPTVRRTDDGTVHATGIGTPTGDTVHEPCPHCARIYFAQVAAIQMPTCPHRPATPAPVQKQYASYFDRPAPPQRSSSITRGRRHAYVPDRFQEPARNQSDPGTTGERASIYTQPSDSPPA